MFLFKSELESRMSTIKRDQEMVNVTLLFKDGKDVVNISKINCRLESNKLSVGITFVENQSVRKQLF